MRGGGGDDASGDDFVELGEILFEERVALIGDLVLRACGLVGVAAIERFDDGHSFGDFAEGSEALGIQERIVSEIDEDLSAARIWR